MNENFTILPLNEGQELNYVETFTGTFEEAKDRADDIKLRLQPILYEGTIQVKVLNMNGKEIFYTGENNEN